MRRNVNTIDDGHCASSIRIDCWSIEDSLRDVFGTASVSLGVLKHKKAVERHVMLPDNQIVVALARNRSQRLERLAAPCPWEPSPYLFQLSFLSFRRISLLWLRNSCSSCDNLEKERTNFNKMVFFMDPVIVLEYLIQHCSSKSDDH